MIKKRIKIIASVLLFCILFGLAGKGFRYILTDDTDSYTRVTFHEMYEQENIDVLFAGSSHCYRSFIPEILDEELQMNTFNVGTSYQKMDGSLMVIREAARYNDIKQVYLEIYYDCAFDVREERTLMTPTYIIADYLKPSLDKYRFLLKASSAEHYANSFIVARRNGMKVFDMEYINDILTRKSTEAYRNYAYDYITEDTQWYAGKGYVANNVVIRDWNYFSDWGWDPIDMEDISSDWREDLINIMDFCEEKGIRLTLVAAPMSDFLLAGVGNYDDYREYVNELIEGRNVEYYDFNLCKEEYFPHTSEMFRDPDHVNCYGAETFSHTFARLVKGEVGPEEMFYDSYEEKLSKLPPTVYGVSYRDGKSKEGAAQRNCRIVAGNSEALEYKVTVLPAKGESYVVRDFSSDKSFTINPKEKGTCRITSRNMETGEEKESDLTIK